MTAPIIEASTAFSGPNADVSEVQATYYLDPTSGTTGFIASASAPWQFVTTYGETMNGPLTTPLVDAGVVCIAGVCRSTWPGSGQDFVGDVTISAGGLNLTDGGCTNFDNDSGVCPGPISGTVAMKSDGRTGYPYSWFLGNDPIGGFSLLWPGGVTPGAGNYTFATASDNSVAYFGAGTAINFSVGQVLLSCTGSPAGCYAPKILGFDSNYSSNIQEVGTNTVLQIDGGGYFSDTAGITDTSELTTGLAEPLISTCTNGSGSGTTWDFWVTALGPMGNEETWTSLSNMCELSTGATPNVILGWAAVPGAVSYNVYGTVSPGAPQWIENTTSTTVAISAGPAAITYTSPTQDLSGAVCAGEQTRNTTSSDAGVAATCMSGYGGINDSISTFGLYTLAVGNQGAPAVAINSGSGSSTSYCVTIQFLSLGGGETACTAGVVTTVSGGATPNNNISYASIYGGDNFQMNVYRVSGGSGQGLIASLINPKPGVTWTITGQQPNGGLRECRANREHDRVDRCQWSRLRQQRDLVRQRWYGGHLQERLYSRRRCRCH